MKLQTKIKSKVCLTILALAFLPKTVFATPSTHSWSPSTDIQANRSFHLTSDFYFPTESDASGSKPDTVTNLGLTTGLWPIKDKLGVEFGFDHVTGYGQLDDYPLYFNAKAGTPENILFKNAPALVIGGYNFGTKHDKTDQNIFYIETAKTISIDEINLGRISFGWFWGNQDLLLDKDANSDADGMILTWERTMSEISDKLWINIDYQGSESGVGALMPAVAWKFAENTTVIFGYVIPNNSDLSETLGVELDIDFGNY